MAKKKPKAKKPKGRPPVGNYLTQINVRVSSEAFEQIEFIKAGTGVMTDADAIRYAIQQAAIKAGYEPKRPQ